MDCSFLQFLLSVVLQEHTETPKTTRQ